MSYLLLALFFGYTKWYSYTFLYSICYSIAALLPGAIAGSFSQGFNNYPTIRYLFEYSPARSEYIVGLQVILAMYTVTCMYFYVYIYMMFSLLMARHISISSTPKFCEGVGCHSMYILNVMSFWCYML